MSHFSFFIPLESYMKPQTINDRNTRIKSLEYSKGWSETLKCTLQHPINLLGHLILTHNIFAERFNLIEFLVAFHQY